MANNIRSLDGKHAGRFGQRGVCTNELADLAEGRGSNIELVARRQFRRLQARGQNGFAMYVKDGPVGPEQHRGIGHLSTG